MFSNLKKIILSFIFFVLIFGYGTLVGKYELFPYHTIKISTKHSINFIENVSLNFKLALWNASKNERASTSNPVRFIAYGDNPYVQEKDVKKAIRGLLDAISIKNPSLIIHLGDTFGGAQPCTNSMLDLQRELMNSLHGPVLYTPGDNEWRDCFDKIKGETHNLDRLAYIRNTYFSNQQTLGRNPSSVENQGMHGYPENARLMIDDVAFITAHVVGSMNNFDPMSKKNTLEYFDRDAANIDWVTASFKEYENANAYVVAMHADMSIPFAPHYHRFGSALLELSNKYQKPVLILFGDSHEFRVFQPMKKKYPFVHAIEVFGYPDIKAIEIEVDPFNQTPFYVTDIVE